jgi:hypothetical protein
VREAHTFNAQDVANTLWA